MRTRIVVRELGKQYLESEGYVKGFISNEWIKIVSDTLHLKELTDEELTNMWDMVELTLNTECLYNRLDHMVEEDMKWADVKSAFLEVINKEARERRNA